MASKPGPLTPWPWAKLGNFKYLLVTPFVIKAIHTNLLGGQEADNFSLVLLIFVAFRYLHNQLWISISRYQNARSKRQIQSKSIEFEQVDRERTWDDYIIFYALLLYTAHAIIPGASNLPLWNTKGLIVTILVHAAPVEFIYYWAHRALHHHFLYSRYHSHHHSSFVTEPITAVVHPFAEHIMYAAIFSMVQLFLAITNTASVGVVLGYHLWIDLMNNMGHCNFEFIPQWTFEIFPLLKYFMYTPSFHSLHHSQVRTNFSLFMPIYDYLYGTVDESSDTLYEAACEGRKDIVDFVYLTHLTNLLSVFHLSFGFASFAAKPYSSSKWYIRMLWPISNAVMLVLSTFGRTFTAGKNRLDRLHMQTWVIPAYTFQYFLPSEKQRINQLIEDSILDAEKKGAKVISLGLLNKNEDLNESGKQFVNQHENLRIRIVDGSTLAAAFILNSIPEKETSEVLLISGGACKLESGIARVLCERGVRVQLLVDSEEQIEKSKMKVPREFRHNLFHVTSYKSCITCKTWIVGRWLSREDQMKAPKGTRFIPLLPFPIPNVRDDCTYETVPAMSVPKNLENLHACENGLPRRVLSAWRVGGIVHALEDWNHHECDDVIDSDSVIRVWEAAIKHGFFPFNSIKVK